MYNEKKLLIILWLDKIEKYDEVDIKMSKFLKEFVNELIVRFHLNGLQNMKEPEKAVLCDMGRRYAKTFREDPEVREKYQDPERLCFQTLTHCYHAGLCVALYYLTEEDFEPSEKTFAVLTQMDTVSFSGLMFSRWNAKKRYAKYQTDFMAEAIYCVLKKKMAESDGECAAFEGFYDAMILVFLAGVVTDVKTLEAPFADLSGLPDFPL